MFEFDARSPKASVKAAPERRAIDTHADHPRRRWAPALGGLALLFTLAMLTGGCGQSGGGVPPMHADPAPQLSLGQTSVSFSSTDVGTTSNETAIVTLQNIGTAALSINSITDSDITDFPGSTTCPTPGSLAPGASCTITIQFTPSTSGPLTGQITISSNAGTGTVSLSGTGSGGSQCVIGPSGGADDFTSGAFVFPVVWNTGPVPVTIQNIALSGDFAIFNGQGGPWPTCPATPFTLNPNQACNWYVKFVPTGHGSYTGALNIVTSCPAQSVITYSYTGTN